MPVINEGAPPPSRLVRPKLSAITAAQIPTWNLPPYIKGRVSVTSYDSDTHMWGYTVLEGGDDAMQNCINNNDINTTADVTDNSPLPPILQQPCSPSSQPRLRYYPSPLPSTSTSFTSTPTSCAPSPNMSETMLKGRGR